MPRLLYLSNARLPTLMAHGLQIAQNCEAFADNGVEVTLWCANRYIPSTERHIGQDIWTHYGIKRNFNVRRLPTLDLSRLSESPKLAPLFFRIQYVTFALAVFIAVCFTRADIYYCRDPLILLLLGLVKPRRKLVYEAHRFNRPGLGAWLQREVLRRCAVTVAITPPLRDRLEERQSPLREKSKIIVAHDGIRQSRFEGMPSQGEARTEIGWSDEHFIIGYVGRLRTLGMEKGLTTLISAMGKLPAGSVSLAIVGGPEHFVEAYRQQWLSLHLPETHFLYAGQVPAERVPRYMSAFNLCAMPLPWTEHFAYDSSPIKLFEYMVSGRALIASDLPSYADVIVDGEHALLVPPSDVDRLANAIARLQQDTGLREQIAANARKRVLSDYTWDARAKHILTTIFLAG
jgi:glycosyltransferase involved in cell wall biosynthesis